MTVIQFRRATFAPLGLAENGEGGSAQFRPALPISSPSDTPQQSEARAFAAATRVLHASEGIGETLSRQRNEAIWWSGFAAGAAWGIMTVSFIALCHMGWPT